MKLGVIRPFVTRNVSIVSCIMHFADRGYRVMKNYRHHDLISELLSVAAATFHTCSSRNGRFVNIKAVLNCNSA